MTAPGWKASVLPILEWAGSVEKRRPAKLRRIALVAGGAGFLGSHLCEYLLKRRWRVICVDNLITGSVVNIKHLNAHPGFKFINKDVTQQLHIPGRIDVIFNLASPASPKDYMALPLETLNVGALGTKNLLDLALTKQAIFIQASTSEVYGDPAEHPQKESYWGNVNPVGPRAVYDEAKRYGETLVMTYYRLYKLPVRIARIFNTYGPRMKIDDGRVVPNLIYQALTGKPLTIYGNGLQTRSFCYVSDMIDGLYKLIKFNEPFPINLGNPEEFTILEFARLVKNLTRSPSLIKFYPGLQDDPQKRCPDITRAKTLLDWTPKISLEDGVRRTINWFKKHPLL